MSPPIAADILFASYGGGHVTMLEPVARKFCDTHSVGYLALTTAQPYLDARRLKYFGYSDLEDAHDPFVISWGAKLSGPFGPNSPVSVQETIAYHGLNFRDLVTEHGESKAISLFEERGRQAFLPVQTMKRLLKRVMPKIVVSTNSPRSERALFLAARDLGIPAVCVVDTFGLHEVHWIKEPCYAARICVLNEQVRSFFIDQGCDPSAVVVTGNPAFDGINTEQMRSKGRQWRADRGISPLEKVILWASNTEPEKHPFTGDIGDPTLPLRIEQELRQIISERNNCHLVVRYHPSERTEFIPARRVLFSPRDECLHQLLHAVDVVVVIASTVCLEASIAGVPVVTVDMSVFTADAPYSAFGMSTGVNNVADLTCAIESAITHNSASSQEVRATDSVCAQIRSLLS